MRAIFNNLNLVSDGMNPVRAKYFIKDKICLFTSGSKQEL